MFADGKTTWLSHKAAGVPGTVRGLALAHAKHGKLPWKDVVLPAVELAEKGFTVNAVLAKVDLLLVASSMEPACRIDDPETFEKTYPRQARTPFNVTSHPALAMGGGFHSSGLPLAFQIVGRPFEEATVYRAAAAYEAAHDWHEKRPAGFA